MEFPHEAERPIACGDSFFGANGNALHNGLKRNLPELMRRSGAGSVFEARIFDDLLIAAARLRDRSQVP